MIDWPSGQPSDATRCRGAALSGVRRGGGPRYVGGNEHVRVELGLHRGLGQQRDTAVRCGQLGCTGARGVLAEADPAGSPVGKNEREWVCKIWRLRDVKENIIYCISYIIHNYLTYKKNHTPNEKRCRCMNPATKQGQVCAHGKNVSCRKGLAASLGGILCTRPSPPASQAAARWS